MRKLLMVAVLLLGILGMAPESRAQFCPGVSPWVFDDVLASDPFCGFITKMAQQNVTLGCIVIDANHRLYCPDDSVTRKQMAAFMARLGDALFPLGCAVGQIMKWNGTAWACAADNTAGGGGTVTSVMAGTGLQGSPNPITGAGSLNVAPSYQLPQACSTNQIPKWNGTTWACAADAGGAGTVTSLTQGTGITLTPSPLTTTGTIAADTAYLQRRVSSTCAAGSSIRVIAADGTVTCQVDNAGPANAFVQNGNAFGATAILGTTDNNVLDLRVNNSRVVRYEPNSISPNVIGGSPANNVTAGVRGATIAGGGVPAGNTDPNFSLEAPNRVTDAYGTVGGGYGNVAGNDTGGVLDAPFATVGGGYNNTASQYYATVGGGDNNTASADHSTVGGGLNNTASGSIGTVGGGQGNTASGTRSTVGGGGGNTAGNFHATVGGGVNNVASGFYSTVDGGDTNVANGTYSAVGGGSNNTAGGYASTVPGGDLNVADGAYSVAMGRRAKSVADGQFHFADGNDFEFASFTPNAFRVRATGGVRFAVGIDGAGAITWSCLLVTGGGWGCSSDRNLKQDLQRLDGGAVLDKLAAMPVYAWSPKGNNAQLRHYGPMAQDFHAAFGLGDDDKMIGFQDADGVALAAIQGLNAKLEASLATKDAEVAALKQELAELRRVTEQMLARMATEGRIATAR